MRCYETNVLKKIIELFAGCKFLHTFADTIRLMATRTAKELQVPLDNGCADPRAIFFIIIAVYEKFTTSESCRSY